MSKELTEQWRNGTLPVGHYYCKLYYNGFKEEIQKCVKSAYSPKSCISMSCGCEGEEVLAPVPTYEEWVKNGTWYTEKSHNELLKKIEELEKQLESETLAKQEGVELVAELKQKVHILNEANMNMENAIASQADFFLQQMSVLESRLKEANDALKEFCADCLLPKCNGCNKNCAGWKAKEYLKKWGVK